MIEKLTDIVKDEGVELPKWADPYISAREYAGVQGKAETIIFGDAKSGKMAILGEKGQVKFKGKSLKEILKPVKKDIKAFDEYLVYRRVPELEGRGIKTGIDLELAKKNIKENSRFEPQAKEITKLHDMLLDKLVVEGLIEKDTAKIIRDNNQMYVPFKRVMEEIAEYGHVVSSKDSFAKVTSPLDIIEGGKGPIISPLESTVNAVYTMTMAAERNKIANQIIRLRDMSPDISKIIKPIKPEMSLVATLEDGTKVFRPKANQRLGVIEVFTEGKRTFYEVPKDLHESMAGMTDSGFNWLVKVASVPARILRSGATTTPEFAFRNPLRDQWSAFVNAKHGFVPFYDFTKGLFSLIGKDKDYLRWKASGGEWSMLTTLDRASNKATLRKVLGERDMKRYLKNPISLLEDISMYGETPTRLGVFKRARKKVSDVEAAFESREASVDFARRGARMKVVSSLYTFFNARLQGMEKLTRTIKENPTKALAKITAVATVPSIINYLTNRDDPKYWEIPEWQRDMFWIIKVKDQYLRIPKGDVGVIFGTTAEKILEYADKNRETRPNVAKLATSIIKETLPISDIGGILPTALRPIVEIATNKSFFLNRPIVSEGKQKLAPQYQYGQYTSETAKALGEKLRMSPAKIEHGITATGAGLARYGLKISDWMLGEMEVIPKKELRPKELADYPLLSAFAVRDPEGFGSESVNNFYEIHDKMQSFQATVNNLKRKGDNEERKGYTDKHKIEAESVRRGLYTKFNSIRKTLSELRKKSELILDSKLSVDEKRKRLDDVDIRVMKLVVPLLAKYNALKDMLKE